MVAAALMASVEQRAKLERMAAVTSLPHRQVLQARGLLWACEGGADDEIGRRCGVDSDAVRCWIYPLVDAHHGRAGGYRQGLGGEIWADYGLKPWKVDRFKVSNDPRFKEKRSMSLLFSSIGRQGRWCSASTRRPNARPRTALSAFAADEIGPRRDMTHDYKRHGTIDLFVAMNVATGEVFTGLRKGHTGSDVLRSSNRSTSPCRADWRCIWCSTISRRTPLRRS